MRGLNLMVLMLRLLFLFVLTVHLLTHRSLCIPFHYVHSALFWAGAEEPHAICVSLPGRHSRSVDAFRHVRLLLALPRAFSVSALLVLHDVILESSSLSLRHLSLPALFVLHDVIRESRPVLH